MTKLDLPDGLALPVVSPFPLQQADPDIWAAVDAERHRQMRSIELIASENFVSRAVLEVQGSVLTNKYAEGYPGRRYYGGCLNVDVAERIAIERAQRLFGARHANVQPHSGSQANQGVYLALLAPGDKILGLDLKAGGHLTHGAKVNLSGRWFQALSYGVDPRTHRVDMDEVERIARKERPRLIVAGGAYPSPIPHAHVTTTTTHKTLRGPRGGMILTNDDDIARKIDSAVFPGLQGGPLMHIVAAKAVALGEALQPSFRAYARAVVENAQALCRRLSEGGLSIVSGGTDCHLGVVDLRPWGLAGNVAEQALERVGITLNKNAVPQDEAKPTVTSGIRVGSAACTSRGMGPDEFQEIGDMILALLGSVRAGTVDRRGEDAIRQGVAALVRRFPLPY